MPFLCYWQNFKLTHIKAFMESTFDKPHYIKTPSKLIFHTYIHIYNMVLKKDWFGLYQVDGIDLDIKQDFVFYSSPTM